MNENDHLEAINEAIRAAEQKMDLGDLSEEVSDEDLDLVYESRFHCGVCVVRTVFEEVWPPILGYVDFLKRRDSGE